MSKRPLQNYGIYLCELCQILYRHIIQKAVLIVDGDVSRIYVIKSFQADSKFVGEECPRHNNSNSGPQVKSEDLNI